MEEKSVTVQPNKLNLKNNTFWIWQEASKDTGQWADEMTTSSSSPGEEEPRILQKIMSNRAEIW